MQNRRKRKPAINSLTFFTHKFFLRRTLGSITWEKLKTSLTEIMLPSWGRLMKVQITAKNASFVKHVRDESLIYSETSSKKSLISVLLLFWMFLV